MTFSKTRNEGAGKDKLSFELSISIILGNPFYSHIEIQKHQYTVSCCRELDDHANPLRTPIAACTCPKTNRVGNQHLALFICSDIFTKKDKAFQFQLSRALSHHKPFGPPFFFFFCSFTGMCPSGDTQVTSSVKPLRTTGNNWI